jgi:hypothetical protein
MVRKSLSEVIKEAREEMVKWPASMKQLNDYRREEVRKLDEKENPVSVKIEDKWSATISGVNEGHLTITVASGKIRLEIDKPGGSYGDGRIGYSSQNLAIELPLPAFRALVEAVLGKIGLEPNYNGMEYR